MFGAEIFDQGFYKVRQDGGTYVTATFYNPDTEEEQFECVRDYDYYDCSRDIDELYYAPINEKVRRIWLHKKGEILEGDVARVIKGRKLPIGKTGTVEKIVPFYDKYRRFICNYVYFEDGTRTNKNNCVLEIANNEI